MCLHCGPEKEEGEEEGEVKEEEEEEEDNKEEEMGLPILVKNYCKTKMVMAKAAPKQRRYVLCCGSDEENGRAARTH